MPVEQRGGGQEPADEHEEKSLIERLRETGTGLEDPNIAGDPDDPADGVVEVEEAEPGDDRPIVA